MLRPAHLAGTWYPGSHAECAASIESLTRCAERSSADAAGVIAPHAGWAFSGRCAGVGYRALHSARPTAQRVVIFGGHRGPSAPPTVFRGAGWDTPLGAIANDRALAATLGAELELLPEPPAAAHADNAVELHLPFVKHFWPGAEVVVIGLAPTAEAIVLGRAVGELLRGTETLWVGSTDLTHYGPSYRFAPRGEGSDAVRWVREVNDRGFLDALVAADGPAALEHARAHRSACCAGAAVACLEAVAAATGRRAPKLASHVLSHDIRPAASFVGYGTLVL